MFGSYLDKQSIAKQGKGKQKYFTDILPGEALVWFDFDDF